MALPRNISLHVLEYVQIYGMGMEGGDGSGGEKSSNDY